MLLSALLIACLDTQNLKMKLKKSLAILTIVICLYLAKRGIFSNPSEITQHLNALLDASYSTRAISSRIDKKSVGKNVGKAAEQNVSRIIGLAMLLLWQENRQSKALLSPSAKTNTQSEPQSKSHENSDEEESLASIDRQTFQNRACR